MTTTNHRTLTSRGVARLLLRGIQANFAPENQPAEVARLVEYLQDLAMARGMMAMLPDTASPQVQQANDDAMWLDAVACELDDIPCPHHS